MRKYTALSFVLVALTGCGTEDETPVLTKTVHTVVMPNFESYPCPTPPPLPDPKKLTDLQVARTLAQAYTNNAQCRQSSESMRRFLEESKKKLEATN
jgi:hypothetical protein